MTGGRFDLVVVRYDHARPIKMIKVIRELTGWGLLGAKRFVESIPASLNICAPFEELFLAQLGLVPPLFVPRLVPGDGVVICPSPWRYDVRGAATFNIILTESYFGRGIYYNNSEYIVILIADWLGVSVGEAGSRLDQLPLTLASGVRSHEVAGRARDMWKQLNAFQTIPPDYIKAIPQQPAS